MAGGVGQPPPPQPPQMKHVQDTSCMRRGEIEEGRGGERDDSLSRPLSDECHYFYHKMYVYTRV